MKRICAICENISEINIVKQKETVEVRGEKIEVEVEYLKCSNCREEFENSKIDSDPVNKAYRKYREEHNMTQPEEIKKLREKYGLTQNELRKLLGWGAVTLSRYENGALQDDTHQNDLWALENPQFVLELIDKRPGALPKDKIKYIRTLYRYDYDLMNCDYKEDIQMNESIYRKCAA